jgi:AcrR family transcriptional regulator
MKTREEQGDLRVRRTHKLLWEALMALLGERAFEEITVTEICDRAMVHRTTFYKHYADKYTLLEQGMHHMYDVLVAEVNRPPSAFSVDQPPLLYSDVSPCGRIPALLQADAVRRRCWQVSETIQRLFGGEH